MTYSKYHAAWADYPNTTTPITAAALDHIEAGIAAADTLGYLNVRDYGAVGNGITDDSLAIQAAIDACSTGGGGVVFFPAGTYLLTVANDVAHSISLNGNTIKYGVKIKSNVHLRGSDAVIKCPYVDLGIGGVSICAITSATTSDHNFSVCGLRFDGGDVTAQTEVSHYMVFIGGGACYDFQVCDNEFWGYRGKAIYVLGTHGGAVNYRFALERNYIHDAGAGNAIGIGYGASDYRVCDNICHTIISPGSAETIIQSSDTYTRGLFRNNHLVNWGDLAIYGVMTDVQIVGNWVQPAPQSVGAAFTGQCDIGTEWNGVVIAGNVFDSSLTTGANTYGIRLTSDVDVVNNLSICDNTISCNASQTTGIYFNPRTSSQDCIVARNTVHGGDILLGKGTHTLVEGNIVENSLQLNGTASMTVRGNYALTSLGNYSAINCDDAIVADNYFAGTTGNGSNALLIVGARNSVHGNLVKHAAGNGTAAIDLHGASYCHVYGNTVVHATGGGQCIQETTGADNNLIEGNFLPGTGKAITKIGSSSVVRRNSGWVTEASGAAASTADGGTISHGLSATPTKVRCTASVAGELISVTTLASGTFTVAIKKHDGTAGTTQTVYWEAEV